MRSNRRIAVSRCARSRQSDSTANDAHSQRQISAIAAPPRKPSAHVHAAGHLSALVLFFWTSALVAQVPVQIPLHDHVLPALALATPVGTADAATASDPGAEAVTLTLVLRRTDPAGFARFLDDLYDPQSTDFRKFLSSASRANVRKPG